MPDLVSYAELEAYLQLPDDSNETAITALLERVEGSLEAACDRVDLPFQAAELNRAEWHDGTGTIRLFTFYPITALDSITLGRDSSSPDETLDTTDLDVVSFDAAGTRITRVDGGRFGAFRSPRYVLVTYDAAEFLPDDAKQAVMMVAAGAVRQFGSEGFKSFKLLDSAGSLQKLMSESDEWKSAVARNRRHVLV